MSDVVVRMGVIVVLLLVVLPAEASLASDVTSDVTPDAPPAPPAEPRNSGPTYAVYAGIAPIGAPWNADPTQWPNASTVCARGSSHCVDQAHVKILVKGIGQSTQPPQQTVLVYDDSTSMAGSDPSSHRCALQLYAGQFAAPAELGVIEFRDAAELRHALDTGFPSAAYSGSCGTGGASNISAGLKMATDELLSKRKPNYTANIVLVSNGLWQTQDPSGEVQRAGSNGIRVHAVCLVYGSPSCSRTNMNGWANATGGLFLRAGNLSTLLDDYRQIANVVAGDLVGSAPTSGVPMRMVDLDDDVGVDASSFTCKPMIPSYCQEAPGQPLPLHNATLVWDRIFAARDFQGDLRVGLAWEVSFIAWRYHKGSGPLHDPLVSLVSFNLPNGSLATVPIPALQLTATDDACSAPCPSRVDIAPRDVNVPKSGTVQFTAETYDANGSRLIGATYTWWATIGTIDQTGYYKADIIPGIGEVGVSATLNGTYRVEYTAVLVGQKDLDPPYIVSSNHPPDGATNVSLTPSIVFHWNELMNDSSLSAAFVTQPAASWDFVLLNGYVSIWTPTGGLAESTRYCIALTTTAADLAGNRFAAPYSFCFTTGSIQHVPSVVSTSPADGAVRVPVDSEVRVAFSEPMDQPVTQTSFHVSPAVPGNFSWNSTSEEMAFAPWPGLSYGTIYSVTVDWGARSASGAFMGKNHTFNFTTDVQVAPIVTATDPANGQNDVPIDSAIRIWFSESMDKQSVESALGASPAVSGALAWQGNDAQLIWSPFSKLQEYSTYYITIGAGAKSAAGASMQAPYEFSFLTSSYPVPNVVRTEPRDGAVDVPVDAQVVIDFNVPMDGNSVATSLTLTPATPMTLSWHPSMMTVTIQPQKPLALSNKYTLDIGAGATSAQGKPLESPFTTSFTTVSKLPDETPPYVSHAPPAEAYEQTPLTLDVTVTDDNSGVLSVGIGYRPAWSAVFVTAEMKRNGTDRWAFTVPASDVSSGRFEYYFSSEDKALNQVSDPPGGEANPYSIDVKAKPTSKPGPDDKTPGADNLLVLLSGVLAAIIIAAVAVVGVRRRRRATIATEPPRDTRRHAAEAAAAARRRQ